MLKKLLCILACFLLSACTTNIVNITNQEDNIQSKDISVNEIGIFGLFDEKGIGYYDFKQGETIQLLKNTKDEQYRSAFTTGFVLYDDHLYYFQRDEETGKTLFKVRDVDGKNAKDLIEIPMKDNNLSLIGANSIYNKHKVIFEANFSKMFEDSSKNESTNQILSYDIEKNELHEVSQLYNTEQKKGLLLGAVDEYAIYNVMGSSSYVSAEEYKTSGKDPVWYTDEVLRSRNDEVYIYNVETNKSELLFKEKGISTAPYATIYGSELLYRQGNDVYAIDVKTKKTQKLFSDEHMIILSNCVDDKVFYVTYDQDIWKYKYYDMKENKQIQYTQTNSQNPDDKSLYITLGNSEYFYCFYADQSAIISKKDFYNRDFDKIELKEW